MQIPMGTIAGIALQAAFGLVAPAAMFLYLRKYTGCARKPFWIGCGVMLVFALILEQNVHTFVLNSPLGARITASPVWLAIYGGAMAALFEEGGRFLAMRYLRKRHRRVRNAWMYGAGHGGFEAFALFTIAAVSNVACIVAVKSGSTEPAVLASVQALAATPFWMFLIAMVERCAAICAQISMSVVMWYGVMRDRKWIFVAFAMHFALDALSALLQTVLPTVILEILICVIAALYALLARRLRRKYESA